MAWIKSYQEVARHPKTKRLAKALDISLPEAIGHLHLLWWWAMDFAKDGDLSNYEAYEIAEAMMWEGDDPKILLNALVDSGFVDQPEDGVYTIHDWADYFGYRRLKDHEKKGRHFDLRRAYEKGIIEKVRQRDGDRCFFCGIKVNWSDKRGKGGGTYALIDPEGPMNEENLVVCCRSCKRDREVQQQDDDLEPNPEQMEFDADQVRNKSESNPDLIRNKSGSNPDLVRNKSESNPDLVRNKSESNPDLVRNKSESNPDLIRNKSGSNPDLIRTKSGLNQELDHGLNPDLLEEIRKEEIRINTTTTMREDETDNLCKLNNYKESNEAKNPIFYSKEIIRNSSLKEEIAICDSKGINGTFYEKEDISNLEYPDRTIDKEETSKMEQELDAFLSAYCRISGKQDYQVNGEVDTALRILKQMPATVAIQYMDELYNERKTQNPDLSVNSLRYFEQGIMERWKRQNRDNTKEKGAMNRGTRRQSNHPNEETDEERREREKWERINANFFARS